MSEKITYTRPTPEGVRNFLAAGASHLMPAVRAYPEAALASKVAIDTCGPVRESEMQELRALYLRAVEDVHALSDRVRALEQKQEAKSTYAVYHNKPKNAPKQET